MALVNRTFTVNVTPGAMPPIVHVSEYDVGRAYTVRILDEQGNTFTIPSGTTASIEGTLNGSVGFTQSATVSNNQVSFTLSESMTAYSGKAWCKIKLTLNDEPIQTCAFILAVDRAGVEAETVIGANGFEGQIQTAVDNYLEEHPVGVEVDPTLTISGAAADAKAVGDAIDGLGNTIDEDCVQFPTTITNIGTESQGIVGTDLSIYNPTETYTGRYIEQHLNEGEQITLSGYSVNSNYPCLVVAFDDNTKTSKFVSTNTSYTDRTYTMPKDGTVYVNGATNTTPPVLIGNKKLTQEQIDNLALANLGGMPQMLKAVFTQSGKLMVKRRISDTESVCVTFAHVGGNSLWNVDSIRKVSENAGEPMSDSFSGSTIKLVSSTDWFGPYIVQAVENADGDVPGGNSYFTGGNHRSTNLSTGGGVTAVETAFAITFDGLTPTAGKVYCVREVDVKWANAVQGNNTSKGDGTGRAVLDESWCMVINANECICENDIVPRESVKLKTYYGLQVYMPSANVVYVGGNTRTPVQINSVSNSGNKTCRTAICSDANFRVALSVEPVDLGLFENSPHGFFTTNSSKLYAYLIGTEIDALENEHFYVRGVYRFW